MNARRGMPYRRSSIALSLGFGLALAAGSAAAQGSLTVYCSYQIDWCTAMVNAFAKDTGIKVAMTQKPAGETFAQIKAEATRNPKGDIWWTGSGDAHVQAAGENLTQAYQSPRLADLHDWARKQVLNRLATKRSASTPVRSATLPPNDSPVTKASASKCFTAMSLLSSLSSF